jgi:hypothetical protein
MTLIEQAEAMAERLGKWEERTYGPFGKQVRVSEETLGDAAAIIRRMVAELRVAEASLATAMGEVNALKDALAQG